MLSEGNMVVSIDGLALSIVIVVLVAYVAGYIVGVICGRHEKADDKLYKNQTPKKQEPLWTD